MDPVDAWLPVAALAFAAMPGIRADDWLVTADLLLAAALAARHDRRASPARGSPAASCPRSSTLGDGRSSSGRSRVPSAALAAGAARRAGRGRGPRRDAARASTAGGPARDPGPARASCSRMPVVALFALLFASADAVFAELARTTLDLARSTSTSTTSSTGTLWVGVVAWGMAGLLAVAAGALPALVPGGPPPASARHARSAAARRPTARRHRRGGRAARWARRARPSMRAAAARSARSRRRRSSWLVDALFAAFVVLQLAYLFGGRDTLSVAGLTYADYARRGFFELVAVAVLAGTLVVALDLAVARRGRARSSAASLALLGADRPSCSLSAFVRLRLYQDAYGWTELRFVVAGRDRVAGGRARRSTAWLVLAPDDALDAPRARDPRRSSRSAG